MARFEKATGRYIFLTIDNVEYRVYFEENGSGIPILMQHTAGADGRQWRHFLSHDRLAQHFRLIAYDLPYHGKSVPPTEKEWWKEEYKLTKDFFMKVPVTLSQELRSGVASTAEESLGRSPLADQPHHRKGRRLPRPSRGAGR